MARRYIQLAFCLALLASRAFAQVTPRDANEAEAWKLYSQYRASRVAEATANREIKQAFGDITAVGYGLVGALASDGSDRAKLIEARARVDAERKVQAELLAKWNDKFYWRYGDLTWSEEKIKDAKTGREMDRTEFALTYFPFDPKNKADAAPAPKPAGGGGPGSGAFRPEGPWNGMQIKYAIDGATVLSKSEGGPFCCWILTLTGNLANSGQLRVTGQAGMTGGLYADTVVTVTAGNATREWRKRVTNPPGGGGAWESFDVAVPIPADATIGSITINMVGTYGSAAAGESRGVSLAASFARDAQSTRTATPPATTSPSTPRTSPSPAPTPPNAGRARSSGAYVHPTLGYGFTAAPGWTVADAGDGATRLSSTAANGIIDITVNSVGGATVATAAAAWASANVGAGKPYRSKLREDSIRVDGVGAVAAVYSSETRYCKTVMIPTTSGILVLTGVFPSDAFAAGEAAFDAMLGTFTVPRR